MIMLDFMEETQGTKEASAIAGALDVGQCRMTTELQEGNKLGNQGRRQAQPTVLRQYQAAQEHLVESLAVLPFAEECPCPTVYLKRLQVGSGLHAFATDRM